MSPEFGQRPAERRRMGAPGGAGMETGTLQRA